MLPEVTLGHWPAIAKWIYITIINLNQLRSQHPKQRPNTLRQLQVNALTAKFFYPCIEYAEQTKDFNVTQS